MNKEILNSLIQSFHVDTNKMYLVNFEEFPNEYVYDSIKTPSDSIEKLLKLKIHDQTKSIINKKITDNSGSGEIIYAFIVFEKDIAVAMNSQKSISLLFKCKNESYRQLKNILDQELPNPAKSIYYLSSEFDSYTLHNSSLNYTINGKIEDYYNDDFKAFDKHIANELSNNKTGIVLLHGQPGTGKTSYIRYLCSQINKKFIYLSPSQCNIVNDPKFFTFLTKYSNSIIVIEDAEEVIKKRLSGNDNFVSNLLNMTDGLLADCLQIQVICTFNSNINEVDPALLRNGRLIGRYEFNELSLDKVQKLKPATLLKRKMVLSDLFNDEAKIIIEKSKSIGFK